MDFLTLHHAYVDEWVTVSYLPTIKTTYDGELNYYDIGILNLKNINPRNYPFSEQLFIMDRQYNFVRLSFDKLLVDRNNTATDDRIIRIETYQSSFQTFIERMKMVLEKVIIDLGGIVPDLSNVEEHSSSSISTISSIDQKRHTIMARSRLPVYTPSITSISGVISILWNEILSLVNKKDQSLSVRNHKIQQIIGQNISHLIFEWRVMLANSQKIFNEDKRFKKNPFPQPQFDQTSATFQISSPVLISTSNPNYQQLMSSSIPINPDFSTLSISLNSNTSSNSSQSPYSSFTTDNLENLSFYKDNNTTNTNNSSVSSENISPKSTLNITPSSPSHNNNSIQNTIQAPQSPAANGWQRAFKRITTLAGTPNQGALGNSGGSIPNNHQSISNSASGGGSGSSSFNSNINSSNSSSSSNLKEVKEKDENNVPIGGIIKSGWMKKRGGKNKSWKKRFFILDMKKTLRYYNYHKEKSANKNQESTNVYNISNPILQSNQLILNSNGNLINPSSVNLENPQINTSANNSTSNNPYIMNSINSSNGVNNNNNNNNNINNNNNNQQQTNQQINQQINHDVTNFENLKYKGSIDLYTSLVVAIKPNTSNINLIENGVQTVKDDSGSYFGMDIITPKRIWHLCCDSSKSMEDWLVVLKSANK